MLLDADDRGVARFRDAPPSWGTALALDCATEGGDARSYSVDLTDPNTYSAPSLATSAPPTIRPPLTGDLTEYSDNQLIAMGYPPRPNPASAQYVRWEHMVTTPVQELHDEPIAILNKENTTNRVNTFWGGAAILQPSTEYIEAYATIWVPPITDDGLDSLTSEWVGIGGETSYNLPQAGIELDLAHYGILRTPVATYYSWYEYYPLGPQPEGSPGLFLAPGISAARGQLMGAC